MHRPGVFLLLHSSFFDGVTGTNFHFHFFSFLIHFTSFRNDTNRPASSASPSPS